MFSILPNVQILYEYLGCDETLLKAAMCTDIKGLVFAGFGDGNIAKPERTILKEVRDRGIIVVRSSRTGNGIVTDNDWMELVG